MRAPLAFLLGKLNFEKEFRNLQARPDEAGAGTRITAEPKTGNLPYSAVEFVVTAQNRIREVKVTGFDNSILNFTFEEESLDPPLAGKLFQFQAPKGAEVVEGGSSKAEGSPREVFSALKESLASKRRVARHA